MGAARARRCARTAAIPNAATPTIGRAREGELSLDDIRDAVHRALVGNLGANSPHPWVRECFLTHAIVQEPDGTLHDYPFGIDSEGKVTLGSPVKVEEKFVPVKESRRFFAEVRASISEDEFEIVVIREGRAFGSLGGSSALPHSFSRASIESGVKVFEGAKVSAYRFGEELDHLYGDAGEEKPKAVLNIVGTLSGVHVAEGADGRAELRARLSLLEGAPPLVAALLERRLVGFSVDAVAEFEPATVSGERVLQATRFLPSSDGLSLDIVSHPAAGGGVIKRVAASILGKTPKGDRSMPNPATPAAPAAGASAETDPVVLAARESARKAAEEIEAIAKKARVREAAASVKAECASAGLDAKAAGLVESVFDGAETYDADKVKAQIAKVREALGLNAAPAVTGAGGVSVGMEKRDRFGLGLEACLMRTNAPDFVAKDEAGKHISARLREAGIDRPASLRRLFAECYGVDLAEGFAGVGNASRQARVRQAVTVAQFGDAWENTLNRLGVRWFENPDFSAWRQVCVVGRTENFLKQERIVTGGYANFSSVAEGENYPEVTSPGDTGQSFTPAKYGGIETITREAILRDDLGVIAEIPQKMGLAAARTLYEFVFARIDPASTDTMDYDEETLCDTDHDINQNKGTTALSAPELIVVWKLMQKFRDVSVDKRIGVTPKFLLVPVDLANTAYDILKPLGSLPGGSSTDNAFIRDMGLKAIVVRHWTDATNWALIADPQMHPWFEMAFVGGQETPQLFFANQDPVGELFRADKTQVKLRHEYGGKVLRHEFIYGEVVAG